MLSEWTSDHLHLRGAPLRAWRRLSRASGSTVLSQVPPAWLMARCGQVPSAEVDGLPALDFVVCSGHGHPVLAVQLTQAGSALSLVPGDLHATGRLRTSIAERAKARLLAQVLDRIPLPLWAWDVRALPDVDAVRRALPARRPPAGEPPCRTFQLEPT